MPFRQRTVRRAVPPRDDTLTPTSLMSVDPVMLPMLRELGAIVSRRGTNGFWVDRAFLHLHCCVNLLESLGMHHKDAVQAVQKLPAVIFGRWAAKQMLRGNGQNTIQAGVAERNSFRVVDLERALVFIAVLAGISGLTIERWSDTTPTTHLKCGAGGVVSVCTRGGVWIPVDAEVLDACYTERALGAVDVAVDTLQGAVDELTAYYKDLRKTPLAIRKAAGIVLTNDS